MRDLGMPSLPHTTQSCSSWPSWAPPGAATSPSSFVFPFAIVSSVARDAYFLPNSSVVAGDEDDGPSGGPARAHSAPGAPTLGDHPFSGQTSGARLALPSTSPESIQQCGCSAIESDHSPPSFMPPVSPLLTPSPPQATQGPAAPSPSTNLLGWSQRPRDSPSSYT